MESRQRLIDAAIQSILEIGYARTTVSEVVKRAGMTKGAHVYIFDSKMDLIKHTVSDLFARVQEHMREVNLNRPGSVKQVENHLQAIADVTLGPEGIALLEIWMASRTDTELRSVFFELEAENQRNRKEWLRAQFGDKVMDETDLDVLTEGVSLIVRGLAMRQIFDNAAAQTDSWLWWRHKVAEDIYRCIDNGDKKT